MKPETEEWVERAEGDFKVAQREAAQDDAVWNVICFLAQQCAEKYLKAMLQEHEIPFRKTHDLVVLLNDAGQLLSELETLRPALAHLAVFGVTARYPGVQADQEAGKEAIATAQRAREAIRGKLGLA